MPIVECQTTECENSGVAIPLGEELRPVDENGAPVSDAAWTFQCGVCGQPITSVKAFGEKK